MPLHAAVQPSEGSARQRHVHYSSMYVQDALQSSHSQPSLPPLFPHMPCTAAHMYMSACTT